MQAEEQRLSDNKVEVLLQKPHHALLVLILFLFLTFWGMVPQLLLMTDHLEFYEDDREEVRPRQPPPPPQQASLAWLVG